jgi:hypothetical protein
MIEYIQSKKECFERCTGLVCLRCGNALSPVETVDNSNRPTFWAGCLSCMIFSPGTQKEVYEKAKEISKDYRNISMDDLCCIVRCIYADHLAAIRELIDTHDLLISQNDIVVSGYKATLKQLEKQIAALTAENSELKTEVEYMDALTRAKMEAEGKWAKAEQRINELEAANYQMAMNRAASERKVIILTEGHEWGFCEECEKIKKLTEANSQLAGAAIEKPPYKRDLIEALEEMRIEIRLYLSGSSSRNRLEQALRKEGL